MNAEELAQIAFILKQVKPIQDENYSKILYHIYAGKVAQWTQIVYKFADLLPDEYKQRIFMRNCGLEI